MNDLGSFLESVASDLGESVSLLTPLPAVASSLPDPLAKLYSNCDGGNVLFGVIYGQVEAQETAKQEPFFPDWFPFGSDQYGVFWLCSREPVRGQWFTAWDHDLEDELNDPVWPDLISFLRGRYERALELRDGTSDFLVLRRLPAEGRTTAVREIKPLTSLSTKEILERIREPPAEVAIIDPMAARAALQRLRAVGAECHLRLEFF